MSKHVDNLSREANELRCNLPWIAGTVRAAADHLAEVERQNRVMRKVANAALALIDAASFSVQRKHAGKLVALCAAVETYRAAKKRSKP